MFGFSLHVIWKIVMMQWLVTQCDSSIVLHSVRVLFSSAEVNEVVNDRQLTNQITIINVSANNMVISRTHAFLSNGKRWTWRKIWKGAEFLYENDTKLFSIKDLWSIIKWSGRFNCGHSPWALGAAVRYLKYIIITILLTMPRASAIFSSNVFLYQNIRNGN